MVIQLPERISPRFGESIAFLAFDILERVNIFHADETDRTALINVSPCRFITPLISTPLACLQHRFTRLGRDFTVRCDAGAPFHSYGNIIHFPVGLRPEDVLNGNFERALSRYRDKTYIPILNFSARINAQANVMRENALQSIHDLLNRQLNLATEFRTAVSYLIDEMVNNVKDHSQGERGFLCAQYYPEGKYLDLCIVDDGIGIFESYRTHGNTTYTSHAQALYAAVTGTSTKNQVGGRGFGIRTSMNMLVDGLGGNFLLMSGNAHIIRGVITEIPYNMSWHGTLVGLRIPFTREGFQYRNYLE